MLTSGPHLLSAQPRVPGIDHARAETFLWHLAGPLKGTPRGYAFIEFDTRAVCVCAGVGARGGLVGHCAGGTCRIARTRAACAFAVERAVASDDDAYGVCCTLFATCARCMLQAACCMLYGACRDCMFAVG
jgi:hypothetical protein